MKITKEKLNKELRSLKEGMSECEGLGDSEAFDVADSWISDNPKYVAAIKEHYPTATDIQGFVANFIA